MVRAHISDRMGVVEEGVPCCVSALPDPICGSCVECELM
jgi:hypothetical protein